MYILIGGDATAEMWTDVRRAAIESDFDAIPDKIFVTHYKNIKMIANDFSKPPVHDSVQALWYWGDSRVGKSWAAKHDFPDLGKPYLKKANNAWWCGYKHEPLVIIEDFDIRSGEKLIHDLKIWADVYPFPVEVKGSTMPEIRPQTLIVTSNYHPMQIWKEKMDIEPIMNRFKVVHFKKLQQDMPKGIVWKNHEVRGAYAPNFRPAVQYEEDDEEEECNCRSNDSQHLGPNYGLNETDVTVLTDIVPVAQWSQ